MKKFLSIKHSVGAFNLSMLLLRIVASIIMIFNHGLPKLMEFSTRKNDFYSFFGLGSKFSLSLTIFAELFCSTLVLLGLFTRLSVLPLIITMLVAIFGAGADKSLLQSELAIQYLIIFLVLLFCGPGKISVDGMMNA